MKQLEATLLSIQPVSDAIDKQIWARINDLTKPPGALGQLESIAFQYARIRGEAVPQLPVKRVYTFAADHGVTKEGVSPYPKEVTCQMVINMINGGAAINVFARHADCDVQVVDVGVDGDLSVITELLQRKVRRGTGNMRTTAAMTNDEAIAAIEVGIELAHDAQNEGITLLGTGEMGIGNTTAASALMHVLLPCPLADIVGRGAGSDDAGVERKRAVIAEAVSLHGLADGKTTVAPLEALAKVGGLEIAGIAGLILGAAARHIPVVVDGFISSAAALVACRLAPATRDYLFFSHLSAEKGHRLFLGEFGARPLLDLGLRLGEGTGAALAMTLVDASVKMLREMATFSSAQVSGETAVSAEGAA